MGSMRNNWTKTTKRNVTVLSFAVVIVLLAAMFFLAVNLGSLKIGFGQMLRGLFIEYDPDVVTVFDLRFPRVIISMLAGAGLAVSGTLFQAVMKNPLADPGIIGVSSGAGFVAAVITAILPQYLFFAPVAAFIGGCLAFFLVYSLSWQGGLNPLRMILVNAVFTGLSSAMSSGMGTSAAEAATAVSGMISMKTWDDVKLLAVYTLIGLALSLFTMRFLQPDGPERFHGRFPGRPCEPEPDAGIGGGRAAGFHRHGGGGHHRLPGPDRAPYGAPFCRKRPQKTDPLLHVFRSAGAAGGGYSGTDDFAAV